MDETIVYFINNGGYNLMIVKVNITKYKQYYLLE